MAKKVLLAAKKPFADDAIKKIRIEVESKGLELVVLSNYSTDDELLTAVADVEGLIVRSDKVNEAVINAAPNLKIIARAGAGYDNIDTAYARGRGIIVENTPGQNSNAVAELTMQMMHQAFRPMTGKQGFELKGKKLGIHGFGNIGTIVSGLARAYGMSVAAYDVKMNESRARELGIGIAKSPDDLYAGTDIVSLNIPLLAETKGSIGNKLLNLMNANGLVINTSRAGIIYLPELEELLARRKGFKYFTDVAPVEKEDGAQNVEIFQRLVSLYPNRVFGTPNKMGAETLEANVNAGVAAAKQVAGFLSDGTILNCVYSTLPQRLQQYGQLAEKLARLNSAFVPSVTEVQFTCYGELNDHVNALKEHILRGLFVSSRGNNFTLDQAVAEAATMGISVKARTPDNQKGYGNAITIDLKNGGTDVHSIRGRVDAGELVASRIDAFMPSMPLDNGLYVVASYKDAAGMAAKVGDPLLSAGFNMVYIGAKPSKTTPNAFAYFMLSKNGHEVERVEVEQALQKVNNPAFNYVKIVDLR